MGSPSAKVWVQILTTLLLLISGDLGDYVQDRPTVRSNPISLAILDNFIHLFMGGLSWLIVDPGSAFSLTTDLCLVMLGSSVIDLDHFIAARSFRIAGAMHAPHRGIFHCSGLLLAISVLLVPMNVNWAAVLLVSFIPHHLRDSTRRGIYMYPPLVHSGPVSKNLVRVLTPCFPWIIWALRARYGLNAPSSFGYRRAPGGVNNVFVA